MSTFLSYVAKDLIDKFGNHLNDITIVMPSKRASIFLNQELGRYSKGALWAPHYLTMSDLFYSLSDKIEADSIECICILYQLYLQHVGPAIMAEEGPEAIEHETLDRFYAWGEILLSDFDDIDKHMQDAKAIFTLIKQTEELTSLDYLEPEQVEVLSKFFSTFNQESKSLIQQRFLRLWSKMYDLYQNLQQQLAKEDKMYQGALFKEVITKLKSADGNKKLLDKFHIVAFVGFNILNNVEKELMKELKKQGKALFYWDYDNYYINDKDSEAGFFMKQNLQNFPCELPKECYDNLSHLKDVTFINSSTNNAAVRYIPEWLSKGQDKVSNHNAIILCNENLLQPTLHSLPTKEENFPHESVNVTMGFPLSDTPIYGFITALLNLQIDGYDKTRNQFRYPFVKSVQSNFCATLIDQSKWEIYHGKDNFDLLCYLQNITDQIGKYYSQESAQGIYDKLYIEAIFQTHVILQKFINIVQRPNHPLQVQTITLRRLLLNVLNSTNIPFHGEPATGLQIMGVLETRCLDFTHLLMLSVEESYLPKGIEQNSMIPPAIREGFNLTTLRHKMAVYAYYFYRLIQRTEHLTCIYNDNCAGNTHNEVSRFLLQLLAETNIPIKRLTLESNPIPYQNNDISITKTPELLARINYRITPTALNKYIKCPLKFYFSNIAFMRTVDDPEDGMTNALLGTIFHDTAQCIYQYIIDHTGSNTISKDILSTLLNNNGEHIRSILDIVFDACYFNPIDEDERPSTLRKRVLNAYMPYNTYVGQDIIYRDVLLTGLKNLLQYDCAHAPFQIIAMEKKYQMDIKVNVNDEIITIHTGGRIDRLDFMDGHVRVVDYKTGMKKEECDSISAIFDTSNAKHPDYILQTCLYSLAVLNNGEERPIQPILFYALKAGRQDTEYDPTVKIKKETIQDIKDVKEEYMEGLKQTLANIYNINMPFEKNKNPKCNYCTNCEYKLLCDNM